MVGYRMILTAIAVPYCTYCLVVVVFGSSIYRPTDRHTVLNVCIVGQHDEQKRQTKDKKNEKRNERVVLVNLQIYDCVHRHLTPRLFTCARKKPFYTHSIRGALPTKHRPFLIAYIPTVLQGWCFPPGSPRHCTYLPSRLLGRKESGQPHRQGNQPCTHRTYQIP